MIKATIQNLSTFKRDHWVTVTFPTAKVMDFGVECRFVTSKGDVWRAVKGEDIDINGVRHKVSDDIKGLRFQGVNSIRGQRCFPSQPIWCVEVGADKYTVDGEFHPLNPVCAPGISTDLDLTTDRCRVGGRGKRDAKPDSPTCRHNDSIRPDCVRSAAHE